MRCSVKLSEENERLRIYLPPRAKRMLSLRTGMVLMLDIEIQKSCRYCKNFKDCTLELAESYVKQGKKENAIIRARSAIENDINECDEYVRS
jgi:hypothetical protein